MKFLRKILLAMLLSIIIPVTAFAQEEPTGFYWADTVMVVGEKNIRIPDISSIATKMVVPLHSTPASIGVVTRPIFEGQNAVTLQDALKNISGINVQNGFGTFDFFLIRGFESLTGGLVLTDGAAEPEVSFYNLYNIERVEALKGPSAFLYGGNPLSGAVNLVRKQPVSRNFANVNGSYGEFQTFRGTFDVGIGNPASDVSFRLNGLLQDSDEYRDAKENNVYAINPALTWQMSDQASVTANFEYVNSDYQPDTGLPLLLTNPFDPQIPDIPRTQSYQTPLDKSDQEMFRLRLDYFNAVSQHLTIRNKFYFTRLDWLSRGTLLNGAFEVAPGFRQVARTFQNLDDQQNLVGNQLEALLSFKTGTIKHNLVTGFEVSRLGDDFNLQLAPTIIDSTNNLFLNLDLLIGLDNPQEQINDISQLSQFPFAVGDARSLVFAPYFINQAKFSEKLQLFFGGRFDVVDYEDSRIDFNFQTFQPEAVETQRNYERFSPMGGVVVTPVPELSLYANAGQSFAPPSSLTGGEPRPEESTQFEVGTKIKALNGKLNTTVAVYHLEKENITIPDAQTGAPSEIGDQRSRGIEFEIAVQPVRKLHAFLTYALTDAELTRFNAFNDFTGQILNLSGNEPAFAPDHILNFWTTKEFDMGVGVGGGFRYVSSQFIDEANTFKIDDYVTLDLLAYYKYKNFRWSLNFKNVTDTEYETRGFGSTSVTPAHPRAVYGSVDFSL